MPKLQKTWGQNCRSTKYNLKSTLSTLSDIRLFVPVEEKEIRLGSITSRNSLLNDYRFTVLRNCEEKILILQKTCLLEHDNLLRRFNNAGIGLMSGTSLDGVDTVLCEITGYDESTQVKQLNFITVDIPES